MDDCGFRAPCCAACPSWDRAVGSFIVGPFVERPYWRSGLIKFKFNFMLLIVWNLCPNTVCVCSCHSNCHFILFTAQHNTSSMHKVERFFICDAYIALAALSNRRFITSGFWRSCHFSSLVWTYEIHTKSLWGGSYSTGGSATVCRCPALVPSSLSLSYTWHWLGGFVVWAPTVCLSISVCVCLGLCLVVCVFACVSLPLPVCLCLFVSVTVLVA